MSRIIDIRQVGLRDGYSHVDTNQTTVDLESNEPFLTAVLGNPKRFHYNSRSKLHVANNFGPFSTKWNQLAYGNPSASLAVQSMHQAFAGHVAYSLTPDTVWYMIVAAVGEHVKQNSQQYANLFTDTPGEQKVIEIIDDSLHYSRPSDWNRTIPQFYDGLKHNIGSVKTDLFVPDFSTTTVEDKIATLIALMDVVSPYYKYEVTTRCHIPQVLLNGETVDWLKLRANTQQLRQMFGGLIGYFDDLLPILGQFIEASKPEGNIDSNFWSSMYKYQSGSGGAHVSGWITAFFAHIMTPNGLEQKSGFDWQALHGGYGGFSLDQFPSHVSKVPFTWNYLHDKIPMVFAAGIFGVDYPDNTFLQPRLGYAVAEV